MTDEQDDPLKAAMITADDAQAPGETMGQVFNGVLIAFLGIVYALRKDRVWSEATDATFISTMEQILASDSLAPLERMIVERVKEEVAALEYPSDEAKK